MALDLEHAQTCAVCKATSTQKMAAKSEEDKKDEHFKQLKLVVFGATGATGTEVVKQGLELGHDITAIVRTPENFKLK